eukprot:5421585-Amphidinium_carterae.1
MSRRDQCKFRCLNINRPAPWGCTDNQAQSRTTHAYANTCRQCNNDTVPCKAKPYLCLPFDYC